MNPTTATPTNTPWWQTTWAAALLGAILLALSFPPADLGWLAWFAVVPWLSLIARPTLSGRRPYLTIWLAGCLHWLLVLHFLRLPHWATAIGWPFLAAYLATYLPLFIAVSRVVVQRWQWSLPLTVMLTWMGCEYIRLWFFTGFGMACLGHTQYRWYALIQAAEFGGATLVGGLVLLPAAWCVGWLLLKEQTRRQVIIDGAAIIALFTAVLVYGYQELQLPLQPTITAALIQGNIDTVFEYEEGRNERVMKEYIEITKVAIADCDLKNIKLDLIAWPESMCRIDCLTFDPSFVLPPNSSQSIQKLKSQNSERFQAFQSQFEQVLFRLVVERRPVEDFYFNPALLIGIDRTHIITEEKYDRTNSVSFMKHVFSSQVGGFYENDVYDKMHCVPFGEYIPFGDWFPWLYRITPLPSGLKPGDQPFAFMLNRDKHLVSPNIKREKTVSTFELSPSICYETVMPQVIRQHMLTLSEQGTTPDILVNVTNDGWFWGSSELDLHLICGVFRAVENRRPLIIAANTGFSAYIDPLGRIKAQGKRHAKDYLIVTPEIYKDRDREWLSSYVRYGEWAGKLGLLLIVVVIAMQVWQRWMSKGIRDWS
jgi:apolipoprotein N-acyltransferase